MSSIAIDDYQLSLTIIFVKQIVFDELSTCLSVINPGNTTRVSSAFSHALLRRLFAMAFVWKICLKFF